MKTTTLFCVAAVLMTLASCQKEPKSETPETQVKLSGGIATRASGNTWSPNDAVGIYMKKGGEPLSANSISRKVENYKYLTPEADGVFSPATAPHTAYFPVELTEVDFIAYYPYKESISDYSYPVDVSSQDNHPAIDLLYSNNATSKTKENPAVALNFQHKLSNLIVNLAAGEGLTPANLEGAVVKITGQKTQGTLSLVSGTVTANESQSANETISLKMNATQGEAIILPTAAIAGRKLTIQLPNINELFEWEIPSNTSFEPGSKYIYNLTIKLTSIEVSSSIENWTPGNGEGANGEADMPDAI